MIIPPAILVKKKLETQPPLGGSPPRCLNPLPRANLKCWWRKTTTLTHNSSNNCSFDVGITYRSIAFLKRTGEHSQAPRPDLILLDLNLPKKGGLEVLEEIKADPNLKNIPVVIVSGNIRDGDIRRAYELQVSSFLMKPLEVDEYFAAIRSLKELWFHAASPAPKPDSSG